MLAIPSLLIPTKLAMPVVGQPILGCPLGPAGFQPATGLRKRMLA
jgi:hypothetical protein